DDLCEIDLGAREFLRNHCQRSAGSLAHAEREQPDFRPIEMARYHLPVLRASSMSDSTISAPTARAVSKPKVGALSGNGRSLSIVLGTVTMPILPFVRSAIRTAP